MKITFINDADHEYELSLELTEEEKADPAGYLLDISVAISRIAVELATRFDNKEDADALAQLLLKRAGELTASLLDDYYEEDAVEQRLYRGMESLYEEWLNGLDPVFGIANEEEFIDLYEEDDLTIGFRTEGDTAEIFLYSEDEDAYTELPLKSVPLSLADENREEFRTHCAGAFLAAVIALDRLYGEEGNSLRESGRYDSFLKDVMDAADRA